MEKINIAEILRDCPKGMKLYSPMCGECELVEIDEDPKYPITVYTTNGTPFYFTADGRNLDNPDAECLLFPSKDQRDWSKFPDKFDITTLKPFDSRVLARNYEDEKWLPMFWGFYGDDDMECPYNCSGFYYGQCIPYEGNEHLLGTTDDCDEYYKTWEK